MSDERNSSANNGARKDGTRGLVSPQYAAYLSSNGWGQAQEYLSDILGKLQTHESKYESEFPNLKLEEAAAREIMKAEAVHSRALDQYGTVYHSPAYNVAAAKLEVVQNRLENLTKPIPLPDQITLNALHKFAASADKDFAHKNGYIHKLRNWDELSPEVQDHLFNRLSRQHKAEYDKTRAEVDKLLAERGGAERILQTRAAEDAADSFQMYIPQAQIEQENNPFSQNPNAKPFLDEKLIEEMRENSLLFFPLEYTPLTRDSQEFKDYVSTTIRKNVDQLELDLDKVKYNIDLAVGVYPHIDRNIETELMFAKLDIVSGASLGTISVLAGDLAGRAAISGAAILGGKVMNSGSGKLLSGAGAFLTENIPMVAKVTGKVSGVASPIVLAGGAGITFDEIALEPLMMHSQDGTELTSGLNTPPLTNEERGEMAEVFMKQGDIPLISPASRMLSFNSDFAEKHPDLFIPAGTPIPSRCISLEVKPNTPEAAEIKTRLGTIDSILKNYSGRETEFWKKLNDELDKLPPLPEEISPEEVSPTEINNNALAKSGQSNNIEGR